MFIVYFLCRKQTVLRSEQILYLLTTMFLDYSLCYFFAIYLVMTFKIVLEDDLHFYVSEIVDYHKEK